LSLSQLVPVDKVDALIAAAGASTSDEKKKHLLRPVDQDLLRPPPSMHGQGSAQAHGHAVKSEDRGTSNRATQNAKTPKPQLNKSKIII